MKNRTVSTLPGLTRPWEIYLVNQTHVDIGYTEPQPIAMRDHAEFIAQALDFCTATDHLPPGERFMWTCEVSWTVKAFLERYPERAEEFFRRVREGRIEVTGLYLNLTDLFEENLLQHTLTYASRLAQEHEFDVVTAMNSDVGAWAWGLPKMMTAHGIKYFKIAINEVRWPLGMRPRPKPFYWASPDGSRVLTWHGLVYGTGNWLRLGEPKAKERMIQQLKSLEDNGYPHYAVEVPILGDFRDNAPPGLWLCDAVREWNACWEFPKIHLCTPRTWFEHIEAHWPEPLQELRAAWPDWWADGNGTALYESALVRAAQADLNTIEAIAAAGGKLDYKRREIVREAAMFFCEHTWGGWSSTDDPNRLESRAGWNMKSSFAYTASVEATALVKDTLRTCVAEPSEENELMVFNPLPYPRTDLVEVIIPDYLFGEDIAAQVLTLDKKNEGPVFHLVESITGQRVPVMRQPVIFDSSRRPGQRARFIARDVPAHGQKRYHIVPEPLNVKARTSLTALTLKNIHFRLSVDPKTGGLISLIEIATGSELVSGKDYTLNQYIYEVIDSPEGRQALSDWGGIRRDTLFRRNTPAVRISPGPTMPFGASLIVEAGDGDMPRLRSEIVLYDDLPRVDLLNQVTKLPIDLNGSDAIYHAFPLAVVEPTVYLDIPGAVMRPGLDQIPGTATDWYSIQHYFAVSGSGRTIVVASPDVPLVQVNGINTGRWQEKLSPHNGLVMSWVMNNYWFTNYPAAQGGVVPYRYSLSSYSGPFDSEKSARFAKGIRQPLVGLVLPGKHLRKWPLSGR